MIVDRVGEFPVVVEDEPATLPSLRPVYRVGEVPVRSYKQVAAPAHSTIIRRSHWSDITVEVVMIVTLCCQ